MMASNRPELSLLALNSHGGSGDETISESSHVSSDGTSEARDTRTSFYKAAHWTRDGTTIITSSYDNQVCSFLVPEDLLESRGYPLTLWPHRTLQLAEPTNIVVSAPYYDIRFPNADHFLVACHDHPLQLYQALTPDRATPEDDAPQSKTGSAWKSPVASYPLVSPTTEAYLQVHSLVWPYPGTQFLVGTRDLIAQFDITRNGDGPVTRIPTIPSRRHIRKGNGIGMRGTVSALSAQTTTDDTPTGLVAAGTWTRRIGLYDIARGGECVSTWSIGEAADNVSVTEPPSGSGPRPFPAKGIGGAGINQTSWSPCGRYLVVNERHSSGMLVYDVRVTNKLLGCLAGRDALTHQRLDCDVFRGLESTGGFEVWAGTRDGTVKVWEGVGNAEGCQWPSWDFSAADGRAGAEGAVSPALGSVGLHHSGSVVATCSGCWTIPDDEEDDGYVSADTDEDSCDLQSGRPQNMRHAWRSDQRRIEESSLKLWKIGPPVSTNEAPDETLAVGEDTQADVSMEEMSEIEKCKLRVVLALETIETNEPEPVAMSGADITDPLVSGAADVSTQDPAGARESGFVVVTASETREAIR